MVARSRAPTPSLPVLLIRASSRGLVARSGGMQLGRQVVAAEAFHTRLAHALLHCLELLVVARQDARIPFEAGNDEAMLADDVSCALTDRLEMFGHGAFDVAPPARLPPAIIDVVDERARRC